MDAATEQVTMIVAVTYSKMGVESKCDRLWIGQEEILVEGRSISQYLEEMRAQGWNLSNSRATANFQGILCEYDFWRLIPAQQSDDTLSITSAQTPADN